MDSAIGLLQYAAHVVALFLISVAIGKVAGPIIARMLESFSSRTKSTLDDRIIRAVKTPIESFFFLVVFYFLLHSFPELVEAANFLEKYTVALLVLIATFMLSEASGAAIRWYYEEGHRSKRLGLDLSLLPLVRKVSKLLIYVFGITIALSNAGFEVTGIFAITSVIAVILGLASQETLANIFAGIALQLDRPYHYGDYLRLPSGEIATVKKIGMRSTKLEDLQHNTIIISNSEFAKMRVTNLSLPDDLSQISISAELPHSADLERLHKKLSSALDSSSLAGLVKDKRYSLSVEQVKPSTVVVSFSFWVKGYQHSAAIKELANRTILGFMKSGKG
ncbi:MAG: mechanosensitive ion channel family protein [Candidatus Micrarchaeota archaeon]|nr:mechanosensitive ion channel family protein [Candidatus Micrarchaeota archaeon]